MKTDCQDIQVDLLQGSSAHAEHVQLCVECRDFAAVLDLSGEVVLEDCEPSLQMDRAVLGYASRRRADASSSPMRMISFLVAAAAAIAVGAYVFMSSSLVGDGAGEIRIAKKGTAVAPSPDMLVDLASDVELSDMLREVADAEYSGGHIDDDLLDLELQLAMLQTEAY